MPDAKADFRSAAFQIALFAQKILKIKFLLYSGFRILKSMFEDRPRAEKHLHVGAVGQTPDPNDRRQFKPGPLPATGNQAKPCAKD